MPAGIGKLIVGPAELDVMMVSGTETGSLVIGGTEEGIEEGPGPSVGGRIDVVSGSEVGILDGG